MEFFIKKLFLFVVIVYFFSLPAFSQTGIDSLKKITTSPSFTLFEDYSGGWGNYSHTFIFTNHDTCEEVLWQDPDFPDGEYPRELKIILAPDELEKLEKLFTDCSQKIHTSKDKGTEHTIYIFKNKDSSYTIDDKFTMLCTDDFKEWKQNLFRKGIEQEQRKHKK